MDKPRELYHEDIQWVPKLAYLEAVQRVKFIHELLIEKEKQADKLAEALELHLKFFEVKTGELLTEDLFTEMQSMSTAKQALAEYRGKK